MYKKNIISRNRGFSSIGGPSYLNVYHHAIVKPEILRSFSRSAVKNKKKKADPKELDDLTNLTHAYQSNPPGGPFKDHKTIDPLD